MDFTFYTETSNPQETEDLASKLADQIKNGGPRVICLYGDLGAGKTVFAKGFAKGLGLTGRILSPTFTVIRQYPMDHSYYYHIDLYRMGDTHSLESIGIHEILNDHSSIVLIEWAERIQEFLPNNRLDIHFLIHAETNRVIKGGLIHE